ncbi:MAG: terminase small subunit [Gammaproteobacteria bacterium]|nr:terminase small subunit [Gammaproteobacteria bacterium]
MIVNKKVLSDILGVSERTLTDWQSNGLPIKLNAGRGASNQYDTADVIEWMIQRALAGAERETARERRDRLEADRIELLIAKEAELLVSVDGVEGLLTSAVVAARTLLRASVPDMAAEIHARYQVTIDESILRDPIDRALAAVAEYRSGGEDDDPARLEELEAADPLDDEGVG